MSSTPITSDLTASLFLLGAVSLAVGGHLIRGAAPMPSLVDARLEREAALPMVGYTPMRAVYRTLIPIARALAWLHISADAVTIGSVLIAVPAAIAFATGHFGIGALIASIAALADAIDGLVARITNTKSQFGKVLDTTVDRYVDSMFLGGIALHVRSDALLLTIVLGAIVGSFMVSYASSVERELGLDSNGGHAPMRRGHRLAFLLTSTAIAPIFGRVLDAAGLSVLLPIDAQLAPILLVASAIALIGNVSAVRRLLRAAGPRPAKPSALPVPPRTVVLHTRENEGE